MENLSRALYIAGFALLFVFAASTAIYLYTMLDAYIDTGTESTKIQNRVENQYGENTSDYQRDITVGEVYLTALHMDQMHVDELHIVVNGTEYSISKEKALEKGEELNYFLSKISSMKGSRIMYSTSGSVVTYRTN